MLDAGGGEKIPSLSEVLDRYGGRFLINIELKNYGSIFDALPLKVARLVKSFGLAESVLISSFNPFNLPRYRRLVPEASLGLITLPNKARHWLYRLFNYSALHPHYDDVDQALVSTLHTKNQQVNVWTPDEPEEIRRLADLKVDGIITNYPQRARETLES